MSKTILRYTKGFMKRKALDLPRRSKRLAHIDVEEIEDSGALFEPVTLNTICAPVDTDWSKWISATATKNYMLGDPLLDWLDHYGKTLPDDILQEAQISGKSGRTGGKSKSQNMSFATYIMQQGNKFEDRLVAILQDKFGTERFVSFGNHRSAASRDNVIATWEAIKQGVPIIHGGVLHNPDNKTYGVPDLIVRSDWLKHLVKVPALTELEAQIPAALS